MHFAYGRNCNPEDLAHIGADMVLVDRGDSIEEFHALVTMGIRRGYGDTITVLNKSHIPLKSRNRLKKHFGVSVRVHEKEGSS